MTSNRLANKTNLVRAIIILAALLVTVSVISFFEIKSRDQQLAWERDTNALLKKERELYAQLSNEQRKYKKLKKDYESGFISKQEFERSKEQYRSTLANANSVFDQERKRNERLLVSNQNDLSLSRRERDSINDLLKSEMDVNNQLRQTVAEIKAELEAERKEKLAIRETQQTFSEELDLIRNTTLTIQYLDRNNLPTKGHRAKKIKLNFTLGRATRTGERFWIDIQSNDATQYEPLQFGESTSTLSQIVVLQGSLDKGIFNIILWYSGQNVPDRKVQTFTFNAN